MNQPLTSKEKTILTVIGMLVGLALLASMTSCRSSKGMTNCAFTQKCMSGYSYGVKYR
jgi:hypothetical protein